MQTVIAILQSLIHDECFVHVPTSQLPLNFCIHLKYNVENSRDTGNGAREATNYRVEQCKAQDNILANIKWNERNETNGLRVKETTETECVFSILVYAMYVECRSNRLNNKICLHGFDEDEFRSSDQTSWTENYTSSSIILALYLNSIAFTNRQLKLHILDVLLYYKKVSLTSNYTYTFD